MAGPGEMQSLFLEELPEAEEAPALGMGTEARGRRGCVAGQRRRTVLASVSVLALLACAGYAARGWAPAPDGAWLAAAQGKSEKIAPFAQCGGEGWTNGTCCEDGCACVPKNKYYSGCKTPSGLNLCSVSRAKAEAKARKLRISAGEDELKKREKEAEALAKALDAAETAREEADAAAEKAKEASDLKNDHLDAEESRLGGSAREKERKAKEDLERITKETKALLAEKTKSASELRDHKLKAAHAARAAAEKAAKEARAAFLKATAAAGAKAKELGTTKSEVDTYEKAEQVRKTKQCGALFGQCTATNCCQLGCLPFWKSKYFCMCEGPNHAKYCAAKEVSAKYGAAKKALLDLQKAFDALDKDNRTKAEEHVAADKKLKEVSDKAEHDIKAAKEEFETNTKGPAEAAAKKLKAAQDTADSLIKEAKDSLAKKTATARGAAKKAEDERDAKDKIAKAKREAYKKAAMDTRVGEKHLDEARQAVAAAKAAATSWVRAASGDPCGKDSDGADF